MWEKLLTIKLKNLAIMPEFISNLYKKAGKMNRWAVSVTDTKSVYVFDGQ